MIHSCKRPVMSLFYCIVLMKKIKIKWNNTFQEDSFFFQFKCRLAEKSGINIFLQHPEIVLSEDFCVVKLVSVIDKLSWIKEVVSGVQRVTASSDYSQDHVCMRQTFLPVAEGGIQIQKILFLNTE